MAGGINALSKLQGKVDANHALVVALDGSSPIATSAAIMSSSPTAGIGYAAGAGGAVTQLVSKATTVELNKITGEITTAADALLTNTAVSFTLTNSTIAAGDMVIVQHVSGGTIGAYTASALAAAWSATVTIRQVTAGNLSEAIVLKYIVFRSTTS